MDLRPAVATDLDQIAVASAVGFGLPAEPDDVAELARMIDPARFLVARDAPGETIVGKTGSFAFDLTLPGGHREPSAGITSVTVAPTHRRRGILRALLTAQHRDLAAAGVAVAALTASEASIYRRFGYGVATTRREVRIDRRAVRFRPDAADPGGVRAVDAAQAATLLPALHDRWAAATPGAISRGDWGWIPVLADRPASRRGESALHHLVHPDGYATYRTGSMSVSVHELIACTDAAHAALWRVLAPYDLVDDVGHRFLAPDDPLPQLLVDPRAVRTTGLVDGIWVRILDVEAVLSARRYGLELDVVLDVTDGGFGGDGPDVAGRYRLRGGPDGAECVRTDAAPDVHLGVAELGSLLLGGTRVAPLAAAGLLRADDPAVRHRLDLAMVTDRAPRHGTEF